MRQQAMTIAGIAQLAGVSKITVSRVLNQHPDVAAATRKHVEQLMAEQGFVGNRAARALKRTSTRMVDVAVGSLGAYTLEVLRGVEGALQMAGYQMLFTALENAPSERALTAKFTDHATDGVILLLDAGQAAHATLLHERGIPLVVIDPFDDLPALIPAVSTTNMSGAFQATDYLLSLGHQRIGFIGGPPGLAAAKQRYAGYLAALTSAGIMPDSDLIRPGQYDQASGYTQTAKVLTLAMPPTAIFAGSDGQAAGVYGALRAYGVALPQAISVIGFDDVALAAVVTPPLTTIRQPLVEMGRVAVSMLLRLIAKQPLDSVHVELPTSLITRESCAPRTVIAQDSHVLA